MGNCDGGSAHTMLSFCSLGWDGLAGGEVDGSIAVVFDVFQRLL